MNFISNPIKGLINFINGRRGLSNDPKPYFQYSIPIHDGKTEVKSFDGTYFVTPFMKNGSIDKIIFKYLRSRGADHEKMNPTIRSKIIFGVASTLKRLKKLGFYSVGLSLKKIFLDDNLEPILAFPIKEREAIGPNYFLSPEEVLLCDEYDWRESGYQSDVFSFAILIYLMFSEDFISGSRKIRNNFGTMIKNYENGIRFSKPENMPEPYWELVEECWKSNPEDRPTFEEITEILKDDKYAIEEFGMKTDLNELHRFREQADN